MTTAALIGYGKMGKVIDRLASKSGIAIVSRIDPEDSQADWKELTSEAVEGADVCIDFSHPDAVVKNIRQCVALKKPIVIGTTGWDAQEKTVQKIVEESKIGAVYAKNFSIGVNLFIQIVKEAAKLINDWPQYDVGVMEQHHRMKADSPSGTAFLLAEMLLKKIDRKTEMNRNRIERKINSDELHVASMRCGDIPGTHSVIIDSDVDTIELVHRARNREGFALGALEAAKWIVGRKGFYHLKEILKQEKK